MKNTSQRNDILKRIAVGIVGMAILFAAIVYSAKNSENNSIVAKTAPDLQAKQ